MESDRLPAIDALAAVVAARADDPSPATRLGAAIELGRELTDLGDARSERTVREADARRRVTRPQARRVSA